MSPVDPKHGEIWIAYLPNKPKDPHQPRPVVIVSPDRRNKNCEDVIVVPLSSMSNATIYPEIHVEISNGEGGLKKASYARCDLVTTLDKTLLDSSGPLGRKIAIKFSWQIIRGIRIAIGDSTA
jgi:mRNA-degrading endonuclease toxin of MazEF toxin-antitoxin module